MNPEYTEYKMCHPKNQVDIFHTRCFERKSVFIIHVCIVKEGKRESRIYRIQNVAAKPNIQNTKCGKQTEYTEYKMWQPKNPDYIGRHTRSFQRIIQITQNVSVTLGPRVLVQHCIDLACLDKARGPSKFISIDIYYSALGNEVERLIKII